MQKRTVALLMAILFAMSGIVVKLMNLSQGEVFETAGTDSTVTVKIASARGTIYDRYLHKLTNTTTRYTASIIATPKTLAELSECMSPLEFERLNEQLKNGKPIVLSADSPFPIADGIRQFLTIDRYAPSQLAAHTIGYLNDSGMNGSCGIEQAFDEVLSDATGSITVTYRVDGNGNVLPGGDIQVSNTLYRANAGISLTLDSQLQNMVEVIAGDAISKGAVVVMDPFSGDILALASFPDFEPTNLSDYLSRQDAPLFNRALASYNCGSVFKTVSAMAALENGVSPSFTHTCSGAETVGENRIKCHYVLGHGLLDMRGGFLQSCNPYFIRLTAQMGGLPLYRLSSVLGFDSRIVLANGYMTTAAVMPSEQAIKQDTVLANLSFGQGDLLASPIHVAQMTACVVNDGCYYRPNLYNGSVDAAGNLTTEPRRAPTYVCSPQTAATIRDMMIGVVVEGSGKAAKPTFLSAGGKTGTAETGWTVEDGETMVQSWFTGFYPAENPQYVITVLAEDSGRTGEGTASVFAELCDHLYRMGYVSN